MNSELDILEGFQEFVEGEKEELTPERYFAAIWAFVIIDEYQDIIGLDRAIWNRVRRAIYSHLDWYADQLKAEGVSASVVSRMKNLPITRFEWMVMAELMVKASKVLRRKYGAVLIYKASKRVLTKPEKFLREAKKIVKSDLLRVVNIALMKMLREPKFGVERINTESEVVYKDMQGRGLRMDSTVLDSAIETFKADYKSKSEVMDAEVGFHLRPNSADDIQRALAPLGVMLPKTKAGRASASAPVLEEIAKTHAIAGRIIELRLAQYKLSMATGVKDEVQANGRVYPEYTFKPELGRVGVAGANYNNWLPELQKAVLPEEGHMLYAVDFAQMEMRVVAALANDEKMKEIIRSGVDLHTATAAKVFNKRPEDITKEERQSVKSINFGILYGKTAYSLAKDLGISEGEAEKLLADYFEAFPGVNNFIKKTKLEATEEGSVETFSGRERDLSASVQTDWSAAMRLAVNHQVQSTAGDLMRIGLINLSKDIQDVNGVVLGTRHDEYILSVPKEVPFSKVEEIAKKAAVTDNEEGFELAVTVKSGERWGF